VSTGCTSIPKTPPYTPSVGAASCKDLRHAAADRATEELLLGTAVALVGVVGIGVGAAMGGNTDPNAEAPEKYGYLLVIAPSVIATVAGVAMMGNSFKTERLEAQTATVLAEGKNDADRFLYYQCVSARADWSGDHSDLARLQVNMMKENLANAQDAQSTAVEAATSAQSAVALSAEAKASATKASQIASASAEATRDLAAVTEMLVETGSRKPAEPVARAPKAATHARRPSRANPRSRVPMRPRRSCLRALRQVPPRRTLRRPRRVLRRSRRAFHRRSTSSVEYRTCAFAKIAERVTGSAKN
jgi:hypothetical protein